MRKSTKDHVVVLLDNKFKCLTCGGQSKPISIKDLSETSVGTFYEGVLVI